MRNVLLGILQSVAAATLAACEGCGPPHALSVVVATSSSVAPHTSPPSSATAGRPSTVISARHSTFRPGDAGVDLSFGRFGHPCDLENDLTTNVMMLQCGAVDAPDESGLTVNFYLPGIWQSGPVTAERVATMIRDSASAESHVEGVFEVADRVPGQSDYFLTMSSVYPGTERGQAFIIKVASLESAVYSVSYTTMFSGPVEAMPVKIREWFAVHLTEYVPQIRGLRPDPSWVPYLRAKHEGAQRAQ